jgi:uncharacterized protein (DUF433 family)
VPDQKECKTMPVTNVVDSLDRHIEKSADIAGGKPRIAGHRITVQTIVIWHQRMGRSIDEICTEHDLGLADVHAALAYYYDHRDDIDRSITDSGGFIDSLRQSTPSILDRRLKELRGE